MQSLEAFQIEKKFEVNFEKIDESGLDKAWQLSSLSPDS